MDTAIAWQNRTLGEVYPIVYMDAVHFKVRDEHRIVTKAAYISMALDMKAFIKDLKPVYKAVNEILALQALETLESKWGDDYPIVAQLSILFEDRLEQYI